MCSCLIQTSDGSCHELPLPCTTDADYLWLKAIRAAEKYQGNVKAIAPCLSSLHSAVSSYADECRRAASA